MMTSDDKVGGWVKKGQNHDDVILELSLNKLDFCCGNYSREETIQGRKLKLVS